MGRFSSAFKAFFQAFKNYNSTSEDKHLSLEAPKLTPMKGFEFMVLLQEKGRLIDFLLEDIEDYSDDQVGGAVRKIHRDCAKALKSYATIEPVLSEEEGSTKDVEANYDRHLISLEGQVQEGKNHKGLVEHSGWKVSSVNIPSHYSLSDDGVITKAQITVTQ